MFFQSHKSLWASTISSGTRSRFLGRTLYNVRLSSNTPFPAIPQPLFYVSSGNKKQVYARKLCGSNFSGVNQISTSLPTEYRLLRIVDTTTQFLLSLWFSWFLIGLIVSTKCSTSNVNTIELYLDGQTLMSMVLKKYFMNG